MDYTVEDTIYLMFTTRAFASGVPTALAGTPVVSAYENDSVTQITAGITLGVSHDSVVGLNLLTIVATAANGYEAGKDYNMVITTGTVDSVSVVGEVVGTFSLGRSAAAVDLANGTDGLGAIKTDTAAILVDTGTTLDGRIPAALVGGRIDANVGAISTDATAADNAEAFFDGTGYAGTNNVIPTVTTLTNPVTLANGAHGGVAAVLTFERIIGLSTTGGQSTVKLTGLGAKPAIELIGGATNAPAMTAIGGGTNGPGIQIEGLGTGAGVEISGADLGVQISGTLGVEVNGETDTNILGSVASVGVGGISSTSFAAGAIDSAAIAASAIGASELAADAVDEILDETIGDGTLTMRQALRVLVAGMAAKLSGAATTTITIRNVADTADVIVATVDANGNRSATTVTP